MAQATRTVNPIHFEDLEPHRFEDLVRQLIYDFRPWHSLEATGRLGQDEGIDIRAFERFELESIPRDHADLEEEETLDPSPSYGEREWRVQCKRERKIGPKKLGEIVEDLLAGEEIAPYGVIVAAACDFSKRSRDEFRQQLNEAGVEEFLLWGKAELEDRLFRPSNDHLLWAYFGISLRIRRRGVATKERSRLATKRRLAKTVGGLGGHPSTHAPVFIRNPEAEDYPWPETVDAKKGMSWRYYEIEGLSAPNALILVTEKHYAWWDRQAGKWNLIEGIDIGWPRDPEVFDVTPPADEESREFAHRFWHMRVPESERAQLVTLGAIHYDQVLVVDDIGDAYHEPPHLVVDFEGRTSPFRSEWTSIRSGYGYDRERENPKDLEHIKYFPKPLPKITFAEWRKHLDNERDD